MTVFSSAAQAEEVFTRLFEILLKDEYFVRRMTQARLSVQLVQTKPDITLFITPDGVTGGPAPAEAAIRIKMSCDTAHALWLGKVLMPVAIATGRVRVKGNIPKVLEFVPILRPAFDQYPAIAAEYGLATVNEGA